jgi:hypothetical protein
MTKGLEPWGCGLCSLLPRPLVRTRRYDHTVNGLTQQYCRYERIVQHAQVIVTVNGLGE